MGVFTKYAARIFGCIMLMIVALAPTPSSGGDPNLVYFTIYTEHFNIHFHQGLEHSARMAASLAEEIHEELTILLGWEVNGPTEMILTDQTDSSNGMAMASPRPLIRLYVTGPRMDVDLSALSSYRDWLRTLITHEYTHVIHLQMHGGVSRIINTIFGDVYLPNQMQPRWFIEGVAVMDETYRTGGGRIRSSVFSMMMRTHALEGHLLTLGELSNEGVAFPRGHAHYIYGPMFLDYLRTRFGEEKIVEICRLYGSATLPYGMNRTFKRVLGVDLVTLYDDWLDEVLIEAKETKERVEADGLTESRAVTGDGETKGKPIFTPKGDALIIPISNSQERSGLYMLTLGSSSRERIARSGTYASVTMDRVGHIYYTRTAPFKNWYRYSDVFVLDRPGEDPRRITYGARAREAAVSPRGDFLVMTVNEAGTTRLVLTDERGNPVRTLIDSAYSDQVYDPAWSPDGRSVATIIRTGPQVDLFIIDPSTGKKRRVTDDTRLEASPSFDPSGRFVVFSSDRSGINNIYAYDLKSDRFIRITNVVSGAIAPAVSPDGRTLAFLKFSSLGWNVHVMDFDPDNAPEVTDDPVELPQARAVPDPSNAEMVSYNPLPSILPRAWMLGLSTQGQQTVLQALVSMSDAVGRHGVAANFNYGIQDNTLSTGFGYSYYGMDPSLHLSFSRRMAPRETGYLVGGEEQRWIQEIISGSAGLSASVPGLDRGHSLSVRYSLIHARPRGDLEIEFNPNADLPEIPVDYFRAGLSFGWSYSDTFFANYGISPEEGRNVSTSVSFYHPALGGRQKLVTFRYGWSEYVEAPWLDHHVFALRLSGGIHVSDPPEQADFSVGGYTEQNTVDALWNATFKGQPSLRGYPPGSFRGDQYHVLKLEYRFPLWWAQAAYKTLPLFFRQLHAGVFTDNALITFDELDRDDWHSSVGAELVWSIYFGYYMPITLRTGYARGLMAGGSNELIVVMGGAF